MPVKKCGECKISSMCIGEDLESLAIDVVLCCHHCWRLFITHTSKHKSVTGFKWAFHTGKPRGTIDDVCSEMREELLKIDKNFQADCDRRDCKEAQEIYKRNHSIAPPLIPGFVRQP